MRYTVEKSASSGYWIVRDSTTGRVVSHHSRQGDAVKATKLLGHPPAQQTDAAAAFGRRSVVSKPD